MKPTLGRIVHFVLEDGARKGETRAAIVAAVFGETEKNLANLHLVLDGPNDMHTLAWRGSVPQDETDKKPGTWHCPPRI